MEGEIPVSRSLSCNRKRTNTQEVTKSSRKTCDYWLTRGEAGCQSERCLEVISSANVLEIDEIRCRRPASEIQSPPSISADPWRAEQSGAVLAHAAATYRLLQLGSLLFPLALYSTRDTLI